MRWWQRAEHRSVDRDLLGGRGGGELPPCRGAEGAGSKSLASQVKSSTQLRGGTGAGVISGRFFTSASGRVKEKVEPFPTVLCTPTSPPCASTMDLTMFRPSPRPASRAARLVFTSPTW